MRLSRLDYNKMHRCPSWSGGGWTRGNDKHSCNASFASFMYQRRTWRWRFTRCRKCGVVCLPYVTRWADPSWLRWRLGRRYAEIYGKGKET